MPVQFGFKFFHIRFVNSRSIRFSVPRNFKVVADYIGENPVKHYAFATFFHKVLDIVVTDNSRVFQKFKRGYFLFRPLRLDSPALEPFSFGFLGLRYHAVIENVHRAAVVIFAVDIENDINVFFKTSHKRTAGKRGKTHNYRKRRG